MRISNQIDSVHIFVSEFAGDYMYECGYAELNNSAEHLSLGEGRLVVLATDQSAALSKEDKLGG